MFSWADFLIFSFCTIPTPGPNNIMCMSSGSSVGFKKTLPLNLGIWLGLSIVMVTITMLCNLLAPWLEQYELYILIVGALYILYLAYKTATQPPLQEGQKVTGGFGRGVALQFINGKTFMYVVLSVETYILPYYAGNILALTGFALLQAFMGFTVTVLYAGAGSTLKVLFGKYRRITNIVMALALVYCAVALFL